MNGQSETVTVFRSMEMDECRNAADLLNSASLAATLLDDTAPGVPSGACVVQVPFDQQGRAEALLAAAPEASDETAAGDAVTPDLDLTEPVYHSEGSTTAEFEAIAIKSLLDANGIASVIIGDAVLPTFPFEVRVAKKDLSVARELIEAQTEAGPQAAEEAELESEQS